MVNKKKVICIGAGVLIMGSLSWASSTIPQTGNVPRRAGNGAAGFSAPANHALVQPGAESAVAKAQGGVLALVPPPAELPGVNNVAMVTAARSMAPAASGMPAAAAKTKTAAAAARAGKPASRVKAAPAMASAKKSGKLFSYVRMLNFSPHPQEEEFLKDKPLALNGHKYWLKVTYTESWDVVDDETGSLEKLGFAIKLMEGDKVVRDLRIPSAKFDVKRMKRGQVLGIAEVAPYKFNIAVDTFKIINGGLSELVFKFDLTG